MAGKTGTGGTFSHKNPDCKCTPCQARRRKAEAIAVGAGEGRSPMAPPPTKATTEAQINADFPLIVQGRSAHEVSHRTRVIQWMNFRAQEPDITNLEVARRLGISQRTLTGTLAKAVAEGWLKFDDPLSRLEHEIIPKAIDNLAGLLRDNDKTATLETVKGTSFPAYRESRGISDGPQTVLALKIEAADPTSVKVVTGTVVGRPKELKE